MRLEGTYTIAAPRAKVWELLMDPKAIASCVPGCEGFEPLGGDKYTVRLTAGVAAISGTFDGTVELKDQVAPESYRLVMEGSGGPGFVNGDAKIVLSESGTSTTVDGDRRRRGRRHHRPRRPAPARQRVEDDARPLLRVHGRKGLVERRQLRLMDPGSPALNS